MNDMKHTLAKNKNAQKGFTLIETFVAITVLITAIAGPLTIASKGLASAILARDQLSATFLAQEGVEFIRHRRDTNTLTNPSGDWLAGLDSCISTSCYVDVKNDTITPCSGTCPNLKLDSTGFFRYGVGDPDTQFRRTISVVENGNNREATITVTVDWVTGIFTRQIVLTDMLVDWH